MTNPIGVAVIGTGWCGGIRAQTLAAHALVKSLHIAEIDKDRLAELKAKLKPASATTDYRELLGRDEIKAVYVSATPESTHYPIAKDCLNAGKHLFLEKPIAMTLQEADELISLAKSRQQGDNIEAILRVAYQRRGLTMPPNLLNSRPKPMSHLDYHRTWCWAACSS